MYRKLSDDLMSKISKVVVVIIRKVLNSKIFIWDRKGTRLLCFCMFHFCESAGGDQWRNKVFLQIKDL